MLSGKKILITGGAGFIASSLAKVICKKNKIILYDNLERNSLIYNKELLTSQNVSFIKGDVLDYGNLLKAMDDCDTVIHAAAIAGIDSVIIEPVKTMEVNMIGTWNVLKAANAIGISHRVVDFSTSEVFGGMAFKVKESDQTVAGTVGEARWTYAVSKLSGEHLAHAYYRQYKLPTVTVRPFNIYGPGQTGEGAMKIFIENALRNKNIIIYGDGTQIRSWCYIDDIVEALVLCLTKEKAVGESFNIGSSLSSLSIYHLAAVIRQLVNPNISIIFKQRISADVDLRIPDTSKAKEILGFQAKVDLVDGIKRTASWLTTIMSG